MYNIINVMCIIEFYLKRVINKIQSSNSSLNISKLLPIDKIRPNYMLIYYFSFKISFYADISSYFYLESMQYDGVSYI